MSNPFWDFSLASYGADEVAQTCIALQDEFGLDVNILLYAAWLASLDRCLSTEHLTGLESRVAPWREQVVQPLRSLRRQWRDYSEAGDIRTRIKALELQAERRQQDMMLAFFSAAGALSRAHRPLHDNLVRVARHGCPAGAGWKPAIERLATLLGD